MADVTTSQVYDGARNYQIKLTNASDGTGQSAVKVIDVTTMTPNPGTHMKLRRLRYTVAGMSVRLQWEASSPVDIAILEQGSNILDFSRIYAGGYPNNGGAGVTGNVLLTTVGQISGSSYTVELEFIKGV